MITAARSVMEEFTDIVIAYGQSDEYRCCVNIIYSNSFIIHSFILRKETTLFGRRSRSVR